MLLRTATAALSTLSFLVCGTSPTTHTDDGVEQVHPSGPDSLRSGATADARRTDRTIATHRVHAIEEYLEKHFPGTVVHGLTIKPKSAA
ncbi:hypothetical protein ABT126_32555 [Streptomyces sp. NPDC002012]|uniref:hypothetical protein n=1 Tax=unclassified Streptomyces TaxID=2593676 RepID=UPI002E144FC0|nr:hypothetical protein OG609_16890 [Streptomyces sp. NBC_01224]